MLQDRSFFAVFCRRSAGLFSELPHEMELVGVTAERGDMMYGHVALPKIHLRQLDSGENDIRTAGNAEKLFIQMLEMG